VIGFIYGLIRRHRAMSGMSQTQMVAFTPVAHAYQPNPAVSFTPSTY
jgi:hypothetical protein